MDIFNWWVGVAEGIFWLGGVVWIFCGEGQEYVVFGECIFWLGGGGWKLFWVGGGKWRCSLTG